MQTATAIKDIIIEKFSQQITLSEAPTGEWRIGIGSLQRASLLNVTEEIIYCKCALDEASEVMFNFIAQGVRTCNMSKSVKSGIYLYR
jgi:hypothetical protein